jgi:D-3-phosphoglycerate dehydrogenase
MRILKRISGEELIGGNHMKIVISDPFSPELPEQLEQFGEVSVKPEDAPSANILLVRSKTKPNKEYIDNCPDLKLIIRGGVGIDNIDVEYAKSKNIMVRNTPEASSVAVAELVFALMLSIQRNIVRAHNTTKNKEWIKKQLKGKELYGKTLGLLGIGRIAREVFKRAAAFGMNIVACDPYVCYDACEQVDKADLFKDSDIISLHVPLNDETREMINKETISTMKDGVIIINTARGKLINEADLAEAVKSGKVSYAGIDVFQNEPPVGSPLLELDNVLLTPHLGAQTYENMDRIGEQVLDIIGEFVKQ